MPVDFIPDEAAAEPLTFVPEEDYAAKLVNDEAFDPIAYAHQNPDDTELAKKVYVERKKRPMTAGRAIGLIPKIGEGAVGLVKDFGTGLGNIAVDAYTQATDSDPANVERAKTQQLGRAQLIEHNVGDFLGKMFGTHSWLGRSKFEQEEKEKDPDSYYGSRFEDDLESFGKQESIKAGVPQDEGLVATGFEAVSGQKPSEAFTSGSELEAQYGAGTGTDPDAIATGATAADPTNLLPLHVPAVAPVLNKVAGAGLRVAGKALQLPEVALKAAGGKVSRALKYGLGGVATYQAAQHPEEALKVAGVVAGVKGAKIVGKLIDTAGAKLINPKVVTNAERAAGQRLIDINTNGGGSKFLDPALNKADLERAATRPIIGAASGAAGALPLAAVATDTPEDAASMVGGGIGLGALAGVTGHNFVKGFQPENIQAVDSILRENGRKDYGTDLDAEHNAFVKNLPENQRDGVDAYRGFFQGFKLADGKEPQIYVLPTESFVREVAKHRSDVDPGDLAESRGYTTEDGKVLINGGTAGGEAGRVLGHESGHVVENILQTLQPEIIKSMRASAEKGLIRDGKPTPELEKFVNEYNKAFDPSGKTKEIDNNETAISEWLAEQASAVLEGAGPAKYAAGESVRQKIADNLSDHFKRLFGTEAEFDRKTLPAVAEEYRSMLFELGRFKGQEPPPKEAVPPKPEPAAPGVVDPEMVNRVSRLEALGIDGARIDSARSDVVQRAVDNEKANRGRRKTSDKAADKIAEEAGAEFDAQVERYLAALEAEGVPHPEGLDLKEAVTLNELALDEGGLPRRLNWGQRAPEGRAEPRTPIEEPLRVVDEPLEGQESATYQAEPEEVAGLQERGWTPEEIAAMPESQVIRELAKPVESPTPQSAPLSQVQPQAQPQGRLASFPEPKTPSQPAQQAPKPTTQRKIESVLAKAGKSKAKRIEALKALLPEGDVVLDRQDPVHIAIMREAGLRGADIDNVIALQKRMGEGVWLRDYNAGEQEGHLEGGADLSAEKRGQELKASPASKTPGQRKGAVTVQDKGFTPYRTAITKDGNVVVLGFDHDKFLDNTRKILDAAEGAEGVNTGFEGVKGKDLDNAVADAFSKVAENHTNGYSGTGEVLPESLGMPVVEGYKPHKLNADQAATINMAMHIRPKDGEVNTLRASLEKAGYPVDKQLKTTISNIRPDLIGGGVHDTPGHGRSVHAHGFDIEPGKLTAKRAPTGKATVAGFLPGKPLSDVAPSIKSKVDDIVPAIRINGEVLKGKAGDTHQDILKKYLDEHPDDADAIANFDSKENQNFFIQGDREISRDEMKSEFGIKHSQQLREKQGLSGFLPAKANDTLTELQKVQKQLDEAWYTKPRDEKQIERLREQQSELLREQTSSATKKEAPQRSERESVPSRPADQLPEGHRVIAHWSPVAGLSEIDPAHHGKGVAGAERSRRTEFPDRYVNRVYFGYGDYKQESGTGGNRYAPDIDFRTMYDYPSDPLDLWPLAERYAGEGANDARKATEYERLIKEHGYLGYYNDNHQVAAVFHKVPAEGSIGGDAFAKNAPEYAKRSPEMVRVLHEYVPNFDKIEGDYFQQRPADTEQVKKQNSIAKEYEAAKVDNLDDPKVKRAYDSLVEKVNDQYDKVLKGIDVEPWADKQEDGTWKSREGQPYKSSQDMQEDIRGKKHLYFFITTPESFGSSGNFAESHPMFQQSGKATKGGFPLMNNDILRAVHDAIAHGSFGVQFGPAGEEAAWRAHMATVNDPWARWALTTETRGQNSWVNFRDDYLRPDGTPKKKGDEGYVPPTERPFADQKADLLDPKWMETGDPVVDEVIKGFDPDAEPGGFLPAKIKVPKDEKFLYGEDAGPGNYWLSPDGKFYSAGDHQEWASKAIVLEEGEKPPMEGKPPWGGPARRMSMGNYAEQTLKDAGWIRISRERMDGSPTMFLNGRGATSKQDSALDLFRKNIGDWELSATGPLDKYRKEYGESDFAKDSDEEYNLYERQKDGYEEDEGSGGFLPAKQTKSEAEDNSLRISTMRPWGGPGEGYVEKGQHTVDAVPFLDNVKGLGDKAVNFFKGEGYLDDLIVKKNSKKTIENITNRIVENLLWLHDKYDYKERSKKWYDGARKISEEWSKEYGHKRQAVAAVMAALSPQLDWYQNVSLAKRVMDIYRDQQDTTWTPEMDKAVDRIKATVPELPELAKPIRGRKFKDLNVDEKAVFTRIYDEAHNSRDYPIVSPEGDFMETATTKKGANQKASWRSFEPIGKAIAALEDPSLENISYQLGNGHKVRNFYNNILLPNGGSGDVTIDTHAVAAALLLPLAAQDPAPSKNFGGISNNQGTMGMYGIYADAYRKAALARNILPREMQSITWEAVRGLFPESFKTPKNKDAIQAIWKEAAAGKITAEQARDQIHEIAGGIDAPSWSKGRHSDAPAKEGGNPGDKGALSEVGVHGKTGGRTKSRRGNGDAGELADFASETAGSRSK